MIGEEKSPRKYHLNSSPLPLGVLLRKPYLLGFSELEISQERPGKCFHGDIKLAVHPAIFSGSICAAIISDTSRWASRTPGKRNPMTSPSSNAPHRKPCATARARAGKSSMRGTRPASTTISGTASSTTTGSISSPLRNPTAQRKSARATSSTRSIRATKASAATTSLAPQTVSSCAASPTPIRATGHITPTSPTR